MKRILLLLTLASAYSANAQKAIEADANAAVFWQNLANIPTAPLDAATKADLRTVIGLPSEVKSASFAAVNLGNYVTTATLTVSDPTPSEGARYSVIVTNGTATIGGTDYSVAGTIVERVYRSATWSNYNYQVASEANIPGRGIRITSVAYTGDSITSTEIPTTTHEIGYPILALLASEKKIPNITDTIGGRWNFAQGGITSATWLSTYVARVAALVSKPSHCVINIGTNDAQTFVPVTNYMANIAAGVTSLRAAGIEPIIMTITPSPTTTNTYWLSARYNRELDQYCTLNQIIFVDTRHDVASNAIEGLEVSGSLTDPGVIGGLHPKAQIQYQYAQLLGQVFAQHVSPAIPSVWSEGVAINEFPNWSATTGSVQYPALNTTGSAALVARADGVTGNLLRLTIANNGTKNIGTGNAGIAFTSAVGATQKDYDVFFRRDFNFANAGNPFISVKTEKSTGRKIIMVWLETASFVVSTQVGALITAMNANPEVAALCTASAMGTPGSAVAVVGSTFDQQNFTTATPASDEVGLTSGKRVRGIMEIWNPGGAQCLGMQLFNAVGTGAFLTKAEVRITNTSGSFSSIPLPSGKSVIATPWFTVTDHRRFFLSCYVGGANGVYDIGRTWVQMESP